jgi:hypothetical protein
LVSTTLLQATSNPSMGGLVRITHLHWQLRLEVFRIISWGILVGMNILIACESSGTVREAFRRRGHEAWSCDLLPADDNSKFHIQGDCLEAIYGGVCGRPRCCPWDLVIAHPPCTHLASSGARHFAAKRADGRQQEGINLFMSVVKTCETSVESWAIENPIGIMSKIYRKPDQIIQPWMFGHGETKATCLWLHNLPRLVPTNIVEGREARIHRLPPSPDRWKIRSKTFQGIADAMAAQWSPLCQSVSHAILPIPTSPLS